MIYLSNLVAGLDTGLDNIQMLTDAVAPFRDRVGIEFFIHSYSTGYKQKLMEIPSWIGTIPLTTHGPFIGVEATSPAPSKERDQLFESYQFAFETARMLGSRHLVFHSSECFVTVEQKPILQCQCLDNLEVLLEIAQSYGITLLLENLGLPCKGSQLFSEEEFIQLFSRFPKAGCLIDMGHLHLAGWNDERVLYSLSNRITGYHLHNNDGKQDSHMRIGDGTYNYNRFFELYKLYTPSADLTLEYGDNHGITIPQLHEDIKRIADSTICCQ